MPKLQGPMFSLRASGTLGRAVTYEDKGLVQRARALPRIHQRPTQLQTLYANKVSALSQAWKTAPPATRNDWSTAAAGTGLNGYTLFWREYFAQNITPPNLPTLP